MSFPFLAILGRQPELGLAELECRLGSDSVVPFGRQALINTAPDLSGLGGAVKLARVIHHGRTTDLLQVPLDVASLPWPDSGKVNIGLSFYGTKATSRLVTATGLELKKRWRQRGSLRLVTPQQGTSLSAAQLLHNGLPGKGFELIVAVHRQDMVVAVTEQVQDIEAYAARDFARPARSAKVGMLPPKLAQILLNTTRGAVADPFCGTGVVLQEALLMGRPAVGSDLEPDMVAASRTNLEWLEEQSGPLPAWSVGQADAKNWRPDPSQAIVTEGYLGPNFSRLPRPAELQSVSAELTVFYRQVLRHWADALPAGSELAMCLPSWRTAKGWADLPIVDELPDLGYTFKGLAHVDTTALRYARPDQVVGRRILLLTRE